MSLRELHLSDLQANACGVWQAPNGVKYLAVPHTIPVFASLTAMQAPIYDYEESTPPQYEFLIKAVSYTGITPGTLIQIQWPDGRYLQNAGVDFFSFCGTGKRARWLEKPKRVPPNAKIRLNLDNSGVNAVSNIELYFEGVLLVPMVTA